MTQPSDTLPVAISSFESSSQGIGEDYPISRERRREIVRQLISSFDMPGTQERYRCLHPVEYRIDENELSYDSAQYAKDLRRRLITLTGSDRIRINDPVYIRLLADRLQQERQAEQERKERYLREAERRRVRRLVVLGLMGARVKLPARPSDVNSLTLPEVARSPKASRPPRSSRAHHPASSGLRHAPSSSSSSSGHAPPSPRGTEDGSAPHDAEDRSEKGYPRTHRRVVRNAVYHRLDREEV